MLGIILFLSGLLIGGVTGVFAMCFVQINRAARIKR